MDIIDPIISIVVLNPNLSARIELTTGPLDSPMP